MRAHAGRAEVGARRRVLLVSHEASRSGAPRVAALVARSLVRAGHDVRIVSRTAGPLMADFNAVAPASVEPLHRARRRLRRLPGARRLARLADQIVAAGVILACRADVVYVNSAAAAAYVRPARLLRRRTILHLHESAAVAKAFLEAASAGDRLDGVRLVACSPSVRDDVARLLDLDTAELALVPSVPDAQEVERRANEALDHPYDADEFVVGCCGTVESRKGADLWVQAARIALDKMPERRIRFVWVGEIAEPVATLPSEPIVFIGPRDNPYPHLRRFDVATLPSRDDPFPLVVLEAMSLGTPVVAFAAGGVPIQVGDAGILVPAEDVDALACALVELVEDHETRARLGAAGRRRAETVYSVPAFDDAVKSVVGG